MTMFRQRVHIFPETIDAWNEAMALCDEYNKLAADKGWAQGTFWMHTVGDGTEIIGEFDFADLASFEREGEEGMKAPDAVALWRKFDALDTVRRGYSELLQTALGVG
jgi:hypothetical protein